MSTISDRDRSWFYSQFLSFAIRKTSSDWERLVTDMMHARHGGAFVQVDAAGRGDKGCDGYINGTMLACYGASSPEQSKVTAKIRDDFKKAHDYWGKQMTRWAFVHNNANGLPAMALQGVLELRADHSNSPVIIEPWPPQVLWDYCTTDVQREQLVDILGAPPSDDPAGMTYLARCVECLARTRLREGLDPIQPIPFGKIEDNDLEPEVAKLIRIFQPHTGHVRFYFSKASPGEQAQVTENLRARYDGFMATLGDAKAVFHALCDQLVAEAFGSSDLVDAEQQRSAAITVVTYFFEICEIFKAPAEPRHDSSK